MSSCGAVHRIAGDDSHSLSAEPGNGWRALSLAADRENVIYSVPDRLLRVIDPQALAEPLVPWQLANRRYLGLSFAVSHSLHLIAIASLALAEPERFHEDNNVWTLLTGGIAYAFIFAMAATSFDRSAAWLGPRRWKLLHTVGSYYIWATFVIVLATFALDAPRYWIGVTVLALVLLLRLLARRTPAPLLAR